jgi:ATP adenylyltransferase
MKQEAALERLWTPWRMQYVSGSGEPSSGCLFCELPREDRDTENLLLQRGRYAFSLLNLYPYNSGHLMIAPYQHTGDLASLAPEVAADVFGLIQRSVAALSDEYQPDGYNIGMNLGRVAGAGVPDHLHVHVIPRWNGDTNFMPLTADTKVLPETLQQTYERLKRSLESASGPISSPE